MKRCFSLFLTLALLLTLLPGTVLAAEEEPAEEPAGQTVTAEAPAQAEAPIPVFQEPALPEEHVEVLAGSGSVSGTVSLPGGAAALADSYLYVYLCTPPVLDEDGQVLAEPVNVKSTRVTLAQGQSSASYTISGVETGEYILRVYSYVNSGSVRGGECYFNADGTPVSNPYAATILNVGSGTSVNLTLPAAPRSISGTLVFDTAPAADTEFRLYCYDDSRSTSYSSAVTLKAGSKTAPFSIGVEPGLYPIQISSMETDAYAHYDIYGNATQDYQKRMVVNTLEESVSGVEINCTSLLDGAAESGVVNVTVNLPAPLTEDSQYEIFLSDEEGYSSTSYSTYLDAGDTSFTLPLSVEEGEPFLVGYCDVTNCSSYYSSPTGARYAAEDGITTQVSQAKVFTAGEVSSITIAEPACYTVTGTLSREGDVLPPQAAYVLASFPDGEVYAARVVYAYGAASASYTIYVPQSQQGKTFQLSTVRAVGGFSNKADESTSIVNGSYTLSGSLQTDLTLPAQTITISGTLSLPAGMTAPEDGLVISLGIYEDYRNFEYATYYLPAGASSLHYALCAPVSGSTVVFAELSGKSVEGMARQAGGTFSQAQLTAADMTFPETIAISGTLSVPENCRDGVALVRLYFSGTLNGSRTYTNLDLAVPAGKVSVPYSFTLPKGMLLTQGQFNVQADTLGILDTSYRYLQNDLKSFSSQYTNLSATLSSDLTLDIQLTQGVFLSGTLSLAEGLSAGTYSGNIRLETVSGGASQSEYFDFTGTSYDYQFSLSEEAMGREYYLSIYLYEGADVLLYKDYYYVSDGVTTTDRSQATPITLGEGGTVVDLTIPKARTISGSLVADDGGEVTWDPKKTLWIYLDSDTGSDSFQATVDAQGNWSAAVDDTVSGTFKLHTYIYDSVPTNIIAETYYYKEGGPSTTSKDEATPVTVGTEDVAGLELYVETGWLLSGSIKLPEGGYITDGTVNVSVSVKNPNSKYSYGNGTVGPDGGSWSVVVPKVEGTHKITLNSVYSPQVSSNIYWGEKQILEDIMVTGDTDGLDFTLVKAKTVITGTVYRPEGVTGSLNLNLYVLVKRGEYSTYSYNGSAYMSSNEDSADFSIALPTTETAEEYQLYYNTYNSSSILSGRNVYLCADGSLTTDVSLAGTFSLAGSLVHTFTPLTVQPFAAGKIYCPEELTENMTIVVDYQVQSDLSTQDMSPTAVEVLIGPGMGQQDEDGRWYSTYSLAGLDEGSSYKLIYYSYVESDLIDTNWHYVNPDGSVVGADKAEVYTVPYGGAVNVVDFTPILWDTGNEDFVLQSGHGFTGNPESTTYTYTYPGATGLYVVFSDRTDTTLLVNGRSYDSSSLAGKTLELDGDTLTIVMPSLADYGIRRFGFAVERIEPVGGTKPEAAAAAVYTASGSSEEAILSGVKSGQPVRITLVGEYVSYKEISMLGALYNAQGMLVDLVQVPVRFADGSFTTSLSFAEYGQAVTLKLFVMDEDCVPKMADCSFSAS